MGKQNFPRINFRTSTMMRVESAKEWPIVLVTRELSRIFTLSRHVFLSVLKTLKLWNYLLVWLKTKPLLIKPLSVDQSMIRYFLLVTVLDIGFQSVMLRIS